MAVGRVFELEPVKSCLLRIPPWPGKRNSTRMESKLFQTPFPPVSKGHSAACFRACASLSLQSTESKHLEKPAGSLPKLMSCHSKGQSESTTGVNSLNMIISYYICFVDSLGSTYAPSQTGKSQDLSG